MNLQTIRYMSTRQQPDNFERIYIFRNDIDAHMAYDLLANQGIESILSNQLMSTILPLDTNTIGGVNMFVRRSDVQKALDILRDSGWKENC